MVPLRADDLNNLMEELMEAETYYQNVDPCPEAVDFARAGISNIKAIYEQMQSDQVKAQG